MMKKVKINSNPSAENKNVDCGDKSNIFFDLERNYLDADHNKKQFLSTGKQVTLEKSNVLRHVINWTSDAKEPKKRFYYTDEFKQSFHATDEFEKWCDFVETINIDFKQEHSSPNDILNLFKGVSLPHSRRVIKEFLGAARDYLAQKNELIEESLSEISSESARRFLFLAPLLADRKFHVYINSTNGCVNVDFGTRDNGVLTTLISDNGQVHYSYVAQNHRIYKLTGTAKFKNSKDFIKFNKILQML